VSRLKLGVIGAGAWGRNHVRAAATLPDVALAAVCDTDPKVRERLAHQQPAAYVTGDVADLLGRVDAVMVASPAATHSAIALQCIEAGLPCLVEKPFALSVRDAEAVARRAAERGSRSWRATSSCTIRPWSDCARWCRVGSWGGLLPLRTAREPGTGAGRRERPVELRAARRFSGTVLAR